MGEKEYELLEHTADIGIRVRADNLRNLFRAAASAMFQIIAEPRSPAAPATQELAIKLSSESIEQLFVNWLNELLSLSATKEIIFFDFKISVLEDSRLEAVVFGRPANGFYINTEIKAATYHELKLQQAASGWLAEVIFDV